MALFILYPSVTGMVVDEGLVAKHVVLHGVSLDNCLLLFIDKTLCKFSSCMKSRFSCISVFVL